MPVTYEALYRERELMDQAVDEGSIEVELTTAKALINFRQRCYTARALDRKRTMEMYEPHETGYGKSRYDGLAFIVMESVAEQGGCTLTITYQPGDLPVGVVKVKKTEVQG